MLRLQKHLPIVFSHTKMVSVFKFKSLVTWNLFWYEDTGKPREYLLITYFLSYMSSLPGIDFCFPYYFISPFYILTTNFKIITHTFLTMF